MEATKGIRRLETREPPVEVISVYQEERRKKQAREAQEHARWQDPDFDFLEEQLLSSQGERERTLRHFLIDVRPEIRSVFMLRFCGWLLRRLDKVEGRKLKP